MGEADAAAVAADAAADSDRAGGYMKRTEIDLADAWRIVCFVRNDDSVALGLAARKRELWDNYEWQVALGVPAADADVVRREGADDGSGGGVDGAPPSGGSGGGGGGVKEPPFPYVRASDFRREVVELVGDRVTLYEELFGFVVCRVRYDIFGWMGEYLKGQLPAEDGTGVPWPLYVQELDPALGRLYWVENMRTGATGYEYVPTDTRTLRYWRYVVWRMGGTAVGRRAIEPERERDVPLVSNRLPRSLFDGVGRQSDGDGGGGGSPFGSASGASGPLRLHSAYRRFLQEAMRLAEMHENLEDAEFELAHPTDYVTLRPTQEIAPEAVSEALRVGTDDMTKAQAVQALAASQEGLRALMAMMRDQQLAQLSDVDGFRAPAGTDLARIAAQRRAIPSKRVLMALRFGRSLPGESRQSLPGIVAGVARQAPATLRDPLIYEQRYKTAIVTLLGPLVSLRDLDVFEADLRGRGGGARKQSGTGTAQTTAGAEAPGSDGAGSDPRLAAARAAALKGLRQRASEFFSWMYAQTFAYFDMKLFDAILDGIDEHYRGALFAALMPTAAAEAAAAGKKKKKKAAVGRRSDDDGTPTPAGMAAVARRLQRPTVRNRVVADAIGAMADGEDADDADGDGEEEEETAVPTASVSDVRHAIWKTLASRAFVPATLVFDMERPSDRARRAGLRQQEQQLDEGMHARRIAESSLVLQQARAGLVHPDDVRKLNGALFGLDTRRPPPPPAPDEEGGGSGGTKRAREADTGGSDGPAKKKRSKE